MVTLDIIPKTYIEVIRKWCRVPGQEAYARNNVVGVEKRYTVWHAVNQERTWCQDPRPAPQTFGLSLSKGIMSVGSRFPAEARGSWRVML